MSLSLRHANEKDIPAVNAIYNEGGVGTTASYDLEPLTVEDQTRWWEGLQAQGYPVMVAVDEHDAVAGFAYLSDFKSKAGYRFTAENTIYIHSDFRGQGVGRLLMDALFCMAKERNIHVLVAAIDARNEGSRAFHQKFGFIESGHLSEVGFKFGRWQSLVLMTCTIDSTEPTEVS